MPEIGDLILDAVEEVLRGSEFSGVRFSLSEASCGAALALARRDAISQIDKNADDLAGTFGMVRGGVVGAVEYPLGAFGYGPASTDRCGGLFQEPYALPPFDAEPSIDVAVQLQVTYAPQFDESGGLVAVAGGSTTLTADEAYVVVISQLFYGSRGPEPLSTEDRADVIDRLTGIGIDTDDIEIISGRQPYEPVQISVEVAVADLPEIGERILDAVEDVLRRSENSGVRVSPNPPMDRDGRREDSGRGEGVTGAMIRARIWVDRRLAGGLQALLGAPMAAYSGCGERDGGIGHGRRRSRTGLARVCGDVGLAGGSVADGRRQAGSGMARSRARARLNCSSQGQRRGRCRVNRRAERVIRPAKPKTRRLRVLVVTIC